MATKEEISKGVYSVINNHTRGKLTPTERRKLRDAILEYEHSQGVVLKVERELPKDINELVAEASEGLIGTKSLSDTWLAQSYIATALHKCHDNMLNAGYTAVGPLIKEEVMAITIEHEDMEKLLGLGGKSIEEARAVWDELGKKYNFDPDYVASVSVDTMEVMIKRDETGPHTEWKEGVNGD